jgi:hypothetical protein
VVCIVHFVREQRNLVGYDVLMLELERERRNAYRNLVKNLLQERSLRHILNVTDRGGQSVSLHTILNCFCLVQIPKILSLKSILVMSSLQYLVSQVISSRDVFNHIHSKHSFFLLFLLFVWLKFKDFLREKYTLQNSSLYIFSAVLLVISFMSRNSPQLIFIFRKTERPIC